MTGFHKRHDYQLGTLSEHTVDPDPLLQLGTWLKDAVESEVINEASAMTVATVSARQPSVRTVLLREIDERGLIFFTNYNSRKGEEIAANPLVAALFYWDSLERQLSIEGTAERVDEQASDAYFATRPYLSQIATVASAQSEAIGTREELEALVDAVAERYPEDAIVPRPQHWGGIRIVPHRFEFWQGRPGRLHDRIRYRLDKGNWVIDRLQP